MPAALPRITARLKRLHGQKWIVIERGHLAALKVRLNEARDLADALVDITEQEESHD
ncbi:hypothetical protein [Brevibacterium casei]|uniref:hypothetical protein n=1 Tax=Brevibacterium casei TaxID=33889 RepID=UPI0013C2DBD4|nr:hypothetical protein [Brevibacterium casei]MBE8146653.1 hypothetical protein [Brevibacterium casei]